MFYSKISTLNNNKNIPDFFSETKCRTRILNKKKNREKILENLSAKENGFFLNLIIVYSTILYE